ncbi:MAG: glycosyltransferase family 2 protein [Clostridia bacterium]|nr:glycosyltransferase family 2 protein [Clostridia bacterium]
MDKISVIVPCYNEEKVIDLFYAELIKSVENVEADFEFVFVDDGSRDKTFEKLTSLAGEDSRVKYISFSKNFGKEAAMLAGFSYARGKYIVVMDADLQHPPALIPKMYERIKESDCDCVATRRISRDNEPPVRSFFAHKFYKLFNKLCGLDVVDGAMDFRMMTKRMVDAILSMPEHGRFSKGIFSWVGFKTEWLEFKNIERAAGETKWSFGKLLLYAIEGFTSFSHLPLYIPAIAGVLLTGVSAVAILVALILHFGVGVAVSSAWALALLILFMFGVQFMILGVFGGYIAKIFVESKSRPQYIIADTNIDC